MLCFIHIKTEWWFIVYYCKYFSLMLKVLTLKAKWKLLLIFNGIKHIKCSQNSLPCKVLFWWTTLYVNGHMIKSAMSRARSAWIWPHCGRFYCSKITQYQGISDLFHYHKIHIQDCLLSWGRILLKNFFCPVILAT